MSPRNGGARRSTEHPILRPAVPRRSHVEIALKAPRLGETNRYRGQVLQPDPTAVRLQAWHEFREGRWHPTPRPHPTRRIPWTNIGAIRLWPDAAQVPRHARKPWPWPRQTAEHPTVAERLADLPSETLIRWIGTEEGFHPGLRGTMVALIARGVDDNDVRRQLRRRERLGGAEP